MSAQTVIITRPEQHSASWASALSEAGFELRYLPLVRTEPLKPTAPEPQWHTLNAVFFVSPSAVEGFNAHFALPAQALLLAPGQGTAQALLRVGAEAERILTPQEGALQDAEHLWEHVMARGLLPEGANLLVVHGAQEQPWAPEASAAAAANKTSGAERFALNALRAGVHVRMLPCYQRAAPELTVAQAEQALAATQDGSVWLFSSSQGIDYLRQALPEAVWTQARCLCVHPQIAHTAQQSGFGHVHTCSNNPNDIVHALRLMCAAQ